MRLPAKQASCDQKNPFLNQATPSSPKNTCQNFQPENPGITPRPHPHPLPTPKYPTLEKNLPTIQTGPSWSSTVKSAGCAELRKREHETIKWEEIVRVFFSSPTPVSDEEQPGTGSGSLGIAGSFFRKSWRKISKKDLTNDSHNLQEVLQQGTEEKNEQLLKLSCLLISCSS